MGPSRLDSLLSDDVIPWQGRAGHPSHLHVVGDLREVQAQVHAVDGHSSAPFRRSGHRQDLREGSGRSNWSVTAGGAGAPVSLPAGTFSFLTAAGEVSLRKGIGTFEPQAASLEAQPT